MNGGNPMSETINVRGPEYFREQAEREYLR